MKIQLLAVFVLTMLLTACSMTSNHVGSTGGFLGFNSGKDLIDPSRPVHPGQVALAHGVDNPYAALSATTGVPAGERQAIIDGITRVAESDAGGWGWGGNGWSGSNSGQSIRRGLLVNRFDKPVRVEIKAVDTNHVGPATSAQSVGRVEVGPFQSTAFNLRPGRYNFTAWDQTNKVLRQSLNVDINWGNDTEVRLPNSADTITVDWAWNIK